MNTLQVVTSESFNGVACDFYDNDGQLFMTRSQIGNALEYEKPNDAIRMIHSRHQERLDNFSTPYKLNGVQDAVLYSQRGVFEICRWSRQAKADQFMDWVWDIIEAYRKGELNTLKSNDYSLLSSQIDCIKQDVDWFNQRLNAIEMKLSSRKAVDKPYIIDSRAVIDPIRDTIAPLAKLYGDNSNGYNTTYRKVYKAMGCDWKYRRTRYKNQKGNKNCPSNLTLIENSKKLMSLFAITVNQLIEEYENSAKTQ